MYQKQDQKQDQDQAMVCHLKWFNTSKGFGFVVPENDTRDVFLHASVLQRGGHPLVGKGALLSCVLEESENGLFVKDIVNVIEAGECPFAKDGEDASLASPSTVRGIVKWYDKDKEFGFIVPSDGVKDIFVHKTCLTQSGLDELIPGQLVAVEFKPVLKGREATTVKVVENP